MTLADEDTNSIRTDNANNAIQGNKEMELTQPGGKVFHMCQWRQLVAQFGTNTSGTTCWLNLKTMQVAPSDGQVLLEGTIKVINSLPGSVVTLAMFSKKHVTAFFPQRSTESSETIMSNAGYPYLHGICPDPSYGPACGADRG